MSKKNFPEYSGKNLNVGEKLTQLLLLREQPDYTLWYKTIALASHGFPFINDVIWCYVKREDSDMYGKKDEPCTGLFNITRNLICRSGEEGLYPDLIEFTEEKLREINPKR